MRVHEDAEFTGAELERLIVDIEAAVGKNVAGLTPLGQAVILLCETASRRDRGEA